MAEVMVPRCPSRTACWTFSVERSKRCWEMTATVFPERFSASMIRSAAGRVMSIGFSTTTCLPASRAATAPSACTPLGVQMVTASMSSRRSTASRSVVASVPYRSASSCALAGSRVDDRDELGEVGQVGQRACVGLADHAGADEGEPELLGTHEYAIPSLSRMAVNARVARVKFVAPESAPNSL